MAKKLSKFFGLLMVAIMVTSAFLVAPAAIETSSTALTGDDVVLMDGVSAKNEKCPPGKTDHNGDLLGCGEKPEGDGGSGSGGSDSDGEGGQQFQPEGWYHHMDSNGKCHPKYWKNHGPNVNNKEWKSGKCPANPTDPSPEPDDEPKECDSDVNKFFGEWSDWMPEEKTGHEFRWRWISKVDNNTGKICSSTKQYQHRPAPQPDPDDGDDDNGGATGGSSGTTITTGGEGYPYVHDLSDCEWAMVRIDGVDQLFKGPWDGIDVSGTGRPDHWFEETRPYLAGFGAHVILPQYCDEVEALRQANSELDKAYGELNGDYDRALTEKGELETKLALFPDWAVALADGTFNSYADSWMRNYAASLYDDALVSYEADPWNFAYNTVRIIAILFLVILVIGIFLGWSTFRRSTQQIKTLPKR